LLTPAVAMLNVPEPVIGPPVNPALLRTLVTVPEPAEAQAQALPLHCRNLFRSASVGERQVELAAGSAADQSAAGGRRDSSDRSVSGAGECLPSRKGDLPVVGDVQSCFCQLIRALPEQQVQRSAGRAGIVVHGFGLPLEVLRHGCARPFVER
jgi:hypothetical protein